MNKTIIIIIGIGLLIVLLGIGINTYGPDIMCNNRCDALEMDLVKSFYAQDQYFCECTSETQHRLVIPMIK